MIHSQAQSSSQLVEQMLYIIRYSFVHRILLLERSHDSIA